MLVKHLKFSKVLVSFLELHAFASIILHKLLPLTLHFKVSEALLFYLAQLLPHLVLLLTHFSLQHLCLYYAILFTLFLNILFFKVSLVLIELELLFRLLILFEGLLALGQFLEELARLLQLDPLLVLLVLRTLIKDAFAIFRKFLAHAQFVHLGSIFVGLRFLLERFKCAHRFLNRNLVLFQTLDVALTHRLLN